MSLLGHWEILKASTMLGRGFRSQRSGEAAAARDRFREVLRIIRESKQHNGAALSIQMQAAQGMVSQGAALDEDARAALVEVLAEIDRQPDVHHVKPYEEWATWARSLMARHG